MTIYVLFETQYLSIAPEAWRAVCTIEGENPAAALEAQRADEGRYMVVPHETVQQFTVTQRPHVERTEVRF